MLQAEYADVVVLGGAGPQPEPEDLTFLRHLVRSEARVVQDLSALTASALLEMRHDVGQVRATHDPRRRRPTGAPDADGIATAMFESWRPPHPERLVNVMEPMVLSSLRTRGAFWLPTRPEAALVWDECCGQLRLAAAARGWGTGAPVWW